MAKKPLVPLSKRPVKKVMLPGPSLPKKAIDTAALAARLKSQVVEKKVPPQAVRYIIQFNNDTAIYAEGALADLLYRYAKECEAQAQMNRLVVYNGPDVQPVPLAELRGRLKDL